MTRAITIPEASSPAIRRSMQANRGKNTSPELQVRQLLREAGYLGYRLHWRKAPGHPDIAYPGRKIAIFVNGCFWHRCPYCTPPMPKTNQEFWEAKFRATHARDLRTYSELEANGWTVLVVWECQLKDRPIHVIDEITKVLRREGKLQSQRTG